MGSASSRHDGPAPHQHLAPISPAGSIVVGIGYCNLNGLCYAGGESINDRLVREGWALNYSKYSSDYLASGAEAKRQGAGVWRGEFVPPWQWRSERR